MIVIGSRVNSSPLPAETITLSHAARDRTAFARGALTAARWVQGKRGWYTMRDVLGLNAG